MALVSFTTEVTERDDIITVKPMFPRKDRFPDFTEFETRNGKVTGWVRGESIASIQCFEFGYMGDVELVRNDSSAVVFKRIRNATPQPVDQNMLDARQIALAFADVKAPPGTWAAKFMKDVNRTVNAGLSISPKQVQYIYAMLYNFRRQLPDLYEQHKHHPHCKKKEG